jgi:hypothetical protein
VIKVVVGVSGAGIMPDPFAVVVNVRSLRVPGRVAIVLRLRLRFTIRLGGAVLGSTMGYRVAPVLFTLTTLMLCPSRYQEHQH